MKKKKIVIVLFSIFAIALICVLSLYCIRASTLLNGSNEETIINSLSEDKDNPIQILALERYEDYLAVLYKSPLDDDPYGNYAHFRLYEKSRHYKNRYRSIGGEYGNFSDVSLSEIKEEHNEDLTNINITETTTIKCFIYDTVIEDEICNIYEVDAQDNVVRKLDELKIPQTDFIMVKEYELLSPLHSLSCAGNSFDYERSFNENYEETDKEQFEIMQEEQKEVEEAYKNSPWIDKVTTKLYDLWNEL